MAVSGAPSAAKLHQHRRQERADSGHPPSAPTAFRFDQSTQFGVFLIYFGAEKEPPRLSHTAGIPAFIRLSSCKAITSDGSRLMVSAARHPAIVKSGRSLRRRATEFRASSSQPS